jgi:hypothetical protein
MIEKISSALSTFKVLWDQVQELVSLKGGLYVDAFAVAMIVRLLAPLFKGPALNASEAGMWAVTIAAFAAGNNTPKAS